VTCRSNRWGVGMWAAKKDRLGDAMGGANRRMVQHYCCCKARRSEGCQKGSAGQGFRSVKRNLTRCCSWTAAIWAHSSGSWSTKAGQKSDEAIRRVVAIACGGGGAQSRACRVVGVSGGGVLPRGGGRARGVSDGVSQTCAIGGEGRSSVRVVHERLTGVVVVLPYVCCAVEV
jgi:hypothetical protein